MCFHSGSFVFAPCPRPRSISLASIALVSFDACLRVRLKSLRVVAMGDAPAVFARYHCTSRGREGSYRCSSRGEYADCVNGCSGEKRHPTSGWRCKQSHNSLCRDWRTWKHSLVLTSAAEHVRSSARWRTCVGVKQLATSRTRSCTTLAPSPCVRWEL